MISASDTKVEDVLPYFTQRGIDVALIVPTVTCMKKSIMDATVSVRQFLKRNNLHDYSIQRQGPDAKSSIPTAFVYADHIRNTTASVYRPNTKHGDPRIWFCKVDDFCVANNLLAMVAIDGTLFVINLSNKTTVDSLKNDRESFVWEVINSAAADSQSAAAELLDRLVKIHKKGFIRSSVRGDTGVGMTLEKQLKIPPNSSKAPDYKGIELKAARGLMGAKSRNRSNLFSQIPDWNNSKINAAQELLDAYGYFRDGRKQLYCTVDASKPNTQGLYFYVDEEEDLLKNRSMNSVGEWKEVVNWKLDTLRSRLSEKHHETFWVKAESEHRGGIEYFRYDEVLYTRSPNIGLLSTLIERSVITMDYTLSQKETRVRDHGYLFKIKPENLELLFPSPQRFDLAEPEFEIFEPIAF